MAIIFNHDFSNNEIILFALLIFFGLVVIVGLVILIVYFRNKATKADSTIHKKAKLEHEIDHIEMQINQAKEKVATKKSDA